MWDWRILAIVSGLLYAFAYLFVRFVNEKYPKLSGSALGILRCLASAVLVLPVALFCIWATGASGEVQEITDGKGFAMGVIRAMGVTVALAAAAALLFVAAKPADTGDATAEMMLWGNLVVIGVFSVAGLVLLMQALKGATDAGLNSTLAVAMNVASLVAFSYVIQMMVFREWDKCNWQVVVGLLVLISGVYVVSVYS
jgi:hypothetical protein